MDFNFLNNSFNLDSLKKISVDNLDVLADEIRFNIIDVMSKVGGHIGPNLGVVELAIALHYVYNSPADKIVWDVSHQSIPHKILTGRFESFQKFHNQDGCSAFTNRAESVHDHFNIGHTSTSVSLAAGLAFGRDFNSESKGEESDEKVIAVIGDGSLSGGEALEGLNIGTNIKGQFLVIVNDNNISMVENSGGLYSNLTELRATNGEAENNIFRNLGYNYLFVEDGHNVESLVNSLRKINESKNAKTVLHIVTKKGKGLKFAEDNPKTWHYRPPFDPETGEFTTAGVDPKRALTVNSIDTTVEFLVNEAKANRGLVILPASPMLGPNIYNEIPDSIIDVGIAEQSAVAVASGIAKNGFKPYLVVASTFLQRSYDQIMQDWTLNNTPATVIVLGGAIASSDYTHIGMYDIPMLSNIPNLVYLSPSCDNEYKIMLEWAKSQNFPTAIRLSGGIMCFDKNRPINEIAPIDAKFSDAKEDVKSFNFKTQAVIPSSNFIAKSELVESGEQICLIGLGWFFQNAKHSAKRIYEEFGIEATVVNARFISHLDYELLRNLIKTHSLFITFEDGQIEGGFGQKISAFISENSTEKIRVVNLGAKKEFLDSVPESELLKRYRLDDESILEIVKESGFESAQR